MLGKVLVDGILGEAGQPAWLNALAYDWLHHLLHTFPPSVLPYSYTEFCNFCISPAFGPKMAAKTLVSNTIVSNTLGIILAA